jgi:S-adenosyl-L-methionine hydrolase (adenosine-forming)
LPVPSRARRRPRVPRWVTLSSDLGAAYAAQMKAVLARELPPGTFLDLAHDLRPHEVAEAAFVVRAMAARFPAGTVHVVVVDPGVGGARAALAVRCRDGSILVGPDNGVLVPLLDALGGGEAFRIEPRRRETGSRVGTTFDGRDVFAPAAARLARGVDPGRLGPATHLWRPPGTAPRRTGRGAVGAVAHVDRFGNLVTDVPSSWVASGSTRLAVRLGRARRRLPLVTSYERGGRGRLVVLASSFGTLEIAVGEGRAADRLAARVGTPVAFGWTVGRAGPVRRKR